MMNHDRLTKLCIESVGYLYFLFVGLAIFFAYAVFVFTSWQSERALFIVEGVTTRFEYRVALPQGRDMVLEGVRVTRGNRVGERVDQSASEFEPFCYFGVLELTAGTRVTFQMFEGLQQIILRRPEGSGDRTVGRLNQSGGRFSFGNSARNPLLLGGDDNDPSFLPSGALSLDETTEITADPACFPENTPKTELVAFAPVTEPVSVFGPGTVGRQILDNASTPGAADIRQKLEFISGTIDMLVRGSLCLRALIGGNCKIIYQSGSDSLTIPGNSALQPVMGNGQDAAWIGQLYFSDGMYHMNISSDASRLILHRPHSDLRGRDYSDTLAVSSFDRLLVEPVLVVLVSALVTLAGMIIGILQLRELEEDNDC